MMALDVQLENLLAALSEDDPCGANLEYDNDFLALEEAARARSGEEFANAETGERLVIEGQGADWVEVRRLCNQLFQRTRDLRVACYYTRALVRTEGFAGLAPGLALIEGLLRQHWETVHPQLDPDDGHDPTMRMNALAPLAAAEALIDDLRSSRLFRSRQGLVLSLRDVEIALGRLSARPGETALSETQIHGLLREADTEAGLGASLKDALASLGAIGSMLDEHAGAASATDLRPLKALLDGLQRAWRAALPAGEVSTSDSDSLTPDAIPPAPAAARQGEINSRDDVLHTLDRLVQYLERAEPTNPAQWLLRRAQRVMHMNFLEAMNELAPDGLTQAERSLGGQLGSQE